MPEAEGVFYISSNFIILCTTLLKLVLISLFQTLSHEDSTAQEIAL